MSKLGKVGIGVFFLFSIGAVIFSFRVIRYIEEKRKEMEKLRASVEELTVSLEERSAELAKRSAELAKRSAELARVREEKTTLEEELRREKELKEEIQRKLNQKIKELQEGARKEREERAALQARLKELLPEVEEQVVEVPPEELPLVPPQRIGGRVIIIAQPFLSLELDQEVVAGLRPTLSIYRKDRLIKELATQGIRRMTLIARVSPEDLEGIGEDDQISLGLSAGAPGIFGLPYLEGEVVDVISPRFLNLDLGKEGLKDIEPTLLVYQGGEPFREIELKDKDRLTIIVEAVRETNIGRIRRKDRVKLIP